MFYLMSDSQGAAVNSGAAEVLIFTPTSNEYKGVSSRLNRGRFQNIRPTVVECGPGKINATFKLAAEVLTRRGRPPAFVVGCGTSGSLSLGLAEGDVIASSSVTISDWRLEDDRQALFTAYGQLDYRSLAPDVAEEIALNCQAPAVQKLMGELGGRDFKIGRMMSSDTFVAGKDHKLKSGRRFNCLACDMESGALAFTAQSLLGGLPWFNLRVVADTLDESLEHYFNKEVDMVEILGEKAAEALAVLDELMES